MIIARQSTDRAMMIGPVLDADGVAVTGCVIGDFKISKNGAAPAALNASATLTHRHTGHYSLLAKAADLSDVGQAEIVIDDTVNACPTKEITVIEEVIYDALFAASANAWAGAAGSTTLGASAVNRAAFAADTGLQSIRSNTAQAGAASTITLDASASATSNFYNGTSILLTGGTGAGQFRIITAYVGATKVATVNANWTTNPSSDTTFAIFPAAASAADIAAAVVAKSEFTALQTELDGIQADTEDIQSRLPAALVSGRIDASVGAMAANVLTNAAINNDAFTASKFAADVGTEIAAATLVAASANPIDANVQEVNDVSLQGIGTAGNKWRPA